jgi:hypothetical protein
MPDDTLELLDEKERIIAVFSKRKRRQIIAVIPFTIVLILFFIVVDGTSLGGVPSNILFPILIALLVIGTVFSFFNWRCPACNRYLRREVNPKHCSHCGAKLQ